ncbi:MAG: hypothetical protein II919_06925 [Lachnospiraceae bacterium]|nr:hypothetical protein [Lachnospiraceae bacterium]
MLNCRRCRKCVYISMITSLVGSASVLSMMRVSGIASEKKNYIPMYIVGAIFWLGIILTYVLTGVASYNRKKAIELGYGEDFVHKIGIISFFENREAKVADLVMAGSILFVIYEILSGFDQDIVILISIFLTIYSVHMHCILNGKNYYFSKVNSDI